MPFSSLPPEILTLVADQLETIKDLFNFIRTNSLLYGLLIDSIYKRNVNSDGGSAIVWYSCQGNEVGVKRMLAAGADVNLRPLNRDQSTALLQAVQHNHTKIAEILLENGATPDAADLRSRRPLTVAASGRSDIAITQLLLDHGAKVNAVASDRRAPLLEAIRTNQVSKSTLLLKNGANPQTSGDRHGMSLLHVAAAKNAYPAILAFLIKAGIPVDSFDGWGRTPLQVAVRHSSSRAVQVLLQHGANPSARGGRESIPGLPTLFLAVFSSGAKSQNDKIIKTLLLHGAMVDSRGPKSQTALLYAISRGATKQARALLEAGADIRATDADGESVLHVAFYDVNPSLDSITWLVENGADVNWIGGKQQETPLFYAIKRSSWYAYAERLLLLGANANFQNVNGMTPLLLASRRCVLAISKVLIKYGACVHSKDLQGKSPLHHVFDTPHANASTQREMAKFLLQHGADVNSRDCNGYTPLHTAVANNWTWEIAEELLQAGADRCAMSNDGRFPYDMIPDGPFAETQRLILRHYPA